MPNTVGHSLGPDGSPTAALFTVDVESDGDELCRLRARGELDAASVATLTAALHDGSRPRRRFVNLDMSAVTFCDAGGLTALLAAHQDFAARDGSLVLCDVPPRVQRIMHIVGLDVLLCGAFVPGAVARDRRVVDTPARSRRRQKITVGDGVTTVPGRL